MEVALSPGIELGATLRIESGEVQMTLDIARNVYFYHEVRPSPKPRHTKILLIVEIA